MKTIFALCLILALACAQSTFKPKWESCEGSHGWKTHKVTLNTAPVAGEDATFTFCGQNLKFSLIDFKEAHVTSGAILDLIFPISINVSWRDTGCYDVNFQIPQGASELTIRFSSNAYDLGEQGCVDVTLNLENNNKFLAF